MFKGIFVEWEFRGSIGFIVSRIFWGYKILVKLVLRGLVFLEI